MAKRAKKKSTRKKKPAKQAKQPVAEVPAPLKDSEPKATTHNPIEPDLRTIRLWHIQPLRDVFMILLVVFFVWFGYYLRGIFTPVLIGILLAYLANPFITKMEMKKEIPRPATISGILLVIFVIGFPLIYILGKVAVTQAFELFTNSDKYLDTFARVMREQFDSDVTDFVLRTKANIADIQKNPSYYAFAAVKHLFAGDGRFANVIENVIGVTTYVAVMLSMIPVYFFFFAWQYGPMKMTVEEYIPRSKKEKTLEILSKMDKAVSGFIRCRLLIGVIMGALFSLGWWSVGVPYAWLLGMGAGLLSLVPFLSGIALPIAIVLKYLKMSSTGAPVDDSILLPVLLWPSIIFVIVQGLEGWVLTPLIQGRSLEMSAVTVVIVVFIGGALGGFYGLLLCVPVAACIKILMREIFLPRLRLWARDH